MRNLLSAHTLCAVARQGNRNCWRRQTDYLASMVFLKSGSNLVELCQAPQVDAIASWVQPVRFAWPKLWACAVSHLAAAVAAACGVKPAQAHVHGAARRHTNMASSATSSQLAFRGAALCHQTEKQMTTIPSCCCCCSGFKTQIVWLVEPDWKSYSFCWLPRKQAKNNGTISRSSTTAAALR